VDPGCEWSRRGPGDCRVRSGVPGRRNRGDGRGECVPVEHDPALAMALSHLEVGQAIPPALYTAIAELLVFLYELDAQQARATGSPAPIDTGDPNAPLSALLSQVS